MNKKSIFLAVINFSLIAMLAFSLRLKASNYLPMNSDEGVYLAASNELAELMRSGKWAGFMQTNDHPEHPQFNKILFAVAMEYAPKFDPKSELAPIQPIFLPQEYNARRLSAVFGALTAGLLAIINPLGGIFLAMHTMTIKYTSEVMLEAVASFTSLAAVLCYIQYKRSVALNQSTRWWIASAAFMGLTAASKYLYALVGIAILLDWALSTPRTRNSWMSFLRTTALWAGVSLLVFLAAYPYLWPDPIGRLRNSLLFHSNYSTNAQEVIISDFPTYQPLIWLKTSAMEWHPQDVFYFSIDGFILIMSVLGLIRLWKTERVFLLWLIVGLCFLFVWPTKWPQYILVLTAPLSLSAGEAAMMVVREIGKDLGIERKQPS